jgi:hypothetical protein
VASAGSITGSDGNTYVQVPATGLTNGSAHTFTVKARNAYGDSAESTASAANTPLSGLVFGDDFNGSAGGAIDPEWWVYTRCGFLAQSEIQYYLPAQVGLDGSGNLRITAQKLDYTGTTYPSDGNRTVTQPWRSGALQSNTRTFVPAAGNTMTFESRFQICHDIAGGMWPGLFWLQGQDYLTTWKTDPVQSGWNDTGKAEIDVAEFNPRQGLGEYDTNVSFGTQLLHYPVTISGWDPSAAMHTYTCRWKPSVSATFLRDTSQTSQTTSVPTSGAHFFLLLYLQVLSGTATATQYCSVDYVRVFDQNLG